MSRGPGKLQQAILEIMAGDRRVYTSGPLDTAEILDELQERGLLTTGTRKAAMYSVRRACLALIKETPGSPVITGYVCGNYAPDASNPGRTTITWSYVREGRYVKAFY